MGVEGGRGHEADEISILAHLLYEHVDIFHICMFLMYPMCFAWGFREGGLMKYIRYRFSVALDVIYVLCRFVHICYNYEHADIFHL